MQTLYDVLGADPDDDAENLKDAYRKAAKANHPDRHASDPEAAARFTRIVTAYDTLRDPIRRAAYDRLLKCQRGPLCSEARRATCHAAYRFAFNAITGVVVGMLAGGGYLLFVRIHGITGVDVGGMTAGQLPRMVAVEPAKRAETAKPEVPNNPGRTTGRSTHSIDTGPNAAASDSGRDYGAEPPYRPRSTEPKTIAMLQDEICERDATQLAHLRISQERNEVIRFERELGCEKLRPQVIRLRESVDPLIDASGPMATDGDPARDHGAEPPEHTQPTKPKTIAVLQDVICEREAMQLAHLRIRRERNEVIRFEHALGCEKLRPQVMRLRESVDPQ